jgi:hypothetical protein
MTTDYRALCAELVALDGHCVVDCTEEWADAMCRLRAALAQPEPAAPTDEEIGEWHDQCADLTRLGEVDHYWAFDLRSDEVAGVVRAALARWGRPTPQPPADGEVAELVEWLTTLRDHDLRHVAPYSHPSIAHWHDFLTRAADLLERPTPQPVAEGPTDEELYELWEQEGYEGDFQDCRRFARAVLARWGTPANTIN